MLSVVEASAKIIAEIEPLASERVDLRDALGRVLAQDIVAPLTLPPWDNSAMDGYAVHAEDIDLASTDTPVILPVLATIAAGHFAPAPLRRGSAMRIMTGAPLPAGADTVVRVEDTDAGLEHVTIRSARDARRNLRFSGEDFRTGETVLAAGTPVHAAQIGILASVGAATVEVRRRPQVAFLGSGDELVDLDRFDEAMAGKKIVSSNSYTMDALIRSAGGNPVDLGVARDEPVDIRERIERSAGCDLLVTTGGVSVGEYDYIRSVLSELGADLRFWKVRMRPGAPLGFGIVRGLPWIGLPGNPVSAMVTFDLFVRPAIRRMLGHERLFRQPVPVVLEERVKTGARLTHFLRAIVTPAESGQLTARLTGPQGSGILTSMSLANALLVVPEEREEVAAGETLHALLINDEAHLSHRFSL